MSWVAAAVVGGTVAGGYMSSKAQSKAAGQAADAQERTSELGIEEQRRQFDQIQKLLSPFVNAGAGALGAQQNLLGLNGAGAQQTAVDAVEMSPQFSALAKQGEEAILANASATGGLRGGNALGALAQFRPQLLAQLIDQQYSRLGGLAQMGQASAAGVGSAGMQTGNNVAQLLGQQGAAQAGAALAAGNAKSQLISSGFNALGALVGSKF
ncbi:hypothetical protein [Massilia sp. ZL223]|uniref:hypothetical protein n=1 Tax=Massilia sp. ZL223 TaxID=2824904 RepID=UPI001B82F1C4|nr:hypothetical protein [Massilia sp. ZL223]MBQ5963141.1 hypothetical protein [Massilia sp. ZL223]